MRALSPHNIVRDTDEQHFHPDADMLREMSYRELRDYALDHGCTLDEVERCGDRADLMELVFATYHGFETVDQPSQSRYDDSYHRRRASPQTQGSEWQNLSRAKSPRCDSHSGLPFDLILRSSRAFCPHVYDCVLSLRDHSVHHSDTVEPLPSTVRRRQSLNSSLRWPRRGPTVTVAMQHIFNGDQ